jgi:hypothetical protein
LRSTPTVLTRLLRAPGVWKARRVAEMAVTPRTRIELHTIDQALAEQTAQLDAMRQTLADIEANLPAVLNAISSMSGASRMVKREIDALRSQSSGLLAEHGAAIEAIRRDVAVGDLNVLGEIRPHIETLAWLMQRVETTRFEVLNELRYGRDQGGASTFEQRIVNPEALERSPLKVNLGAGHVPLDGYVNVDMRDLPGIDVVATIDDLPFEPGTLDEIASSHTVEHFPLELLRRQLLPYWHSLLKPGGTLSTVAPDLEAMSADYVRGDTPFADFREVLYGAQEYEGDAHANGFTPGSFCDLLVESGFVDPIVVVADRPNGKCKEFEITARRSD